MTLAYLDFDYNEDAQGHGCWDAMACVATQRLPAVLQEVTTVLSWAQAQAGLVRGAWEEGGDWDAVLQVQTEDGQPLAVVCEPHTQALWLAQAAAQPRVVVLFTVAGSAAFAAAFEERFSLGQ